MNMDRLTFHKASLRAIVVLTIALLVLVGLSWKATLALLIIVAVGVIHSIRYPTEDDHAH